MASDAAQDATTHDSGPPKEALEPTPAPEPTGKPVIETCRFCRRPSECPNCQQPLGEKKKSDGAVDIDGKIEDRHHQILPEPVKAPKKNSNYWACVPPGEPHYQDWSVFLAGSIEMGKAVQWQNQMALLLQDLPISTYNPRRGHWNPNATPEAKNEEFRHQVEWELEALTRAKVICFFFDHDTMSPVTMCELGLWAHSGKVVVCCNKKFWKSGNVHIVCQRYGIPLVEEFKDLPGLIRAMLRQKGMMVDKDGNLTENPIAEVNERLPKESVAQKTLEDAGLKPPVQHVYEATMAAPAPAAN